MNKYEWMQNDPAGFMFSCINGADKSRIIRFSVVLKETVDPQILKKAVEKTCRFYPVMQHRAKNGFFWGYLERTEKLPRVAEETYRPSSLRRLGRDGRPEYEVLYYKRRISVEGNHILADGMGFMEYLKTLTANYLILSGMDKEDFK